MGIKQARLDSLIQTVEKTPTDNELCDSAARQGNQHLISEARQKNYTPSLNPQTRLLKNTTLPTTPSNSSIKPNYPQRLNRKRSSSDPQHYIQRNKQQKIKN